jgi:HD-like signal output (HDOD) protein
MLQPDQKGLVMASVVATESKKYKHPAFEGLSDSQLIAVYSIGSVRTINAGGFLFKEGDIDLATYLIFKGSVQIQTNGKDQAGQIAVFRQGDSVPRMLFLKDQRRTASAVALEPLMAFVFDETSLNGLHDQIQLTIYKNLDKLSGFRINDLIINQIALSHRNTCLTSELADFLRARTQQYASSKTIQGFLKRVPRLPVYASRLAVMLLDENVSTRDVAELAKLDPSLVGMVLKTVNSAYYGFRHEISNFQHAVLLLGFNQIYQMIVDIGVRSTMPKTREFRQLQFHSVMVSVIGFEICQLSRVRNGALVSTIGLLHDIGESVILLLRQRNPKMAFLIDLLDHTKIGSLLLKEWNIPGVVCDSLEYQCYPELAPPEIIPEEYRKNVAALYMAHLCYEYLLGKSESDLPTGFLGEYMDVLQCPERSVGEFVEKKLFPSLNKRLKTFPQAVQNFLTKSEDNVLRKRKETPEERTVQE